PDYMAPETAQPECNLADPRIDIYSLGVVMYEIYTGVLPFEGKTLMEKIQQHLEGKVRPPSAMNPDFPEQLEHVILTSMKRDPYERFHDMGELLMALRRLKF
ncbi:protein kinase, partial [bacterium]|nr:protein kinase [bacterium]